METWNKMKHFLRDRRQFFHILLVIFAALLSVMVIFYIYAANENTNNIIDQYYQSQEEYLRQNIDFIHSDLSSVFSLANNTLYNSIVIQSVMNPTVVNYEHKLNLVNVLADTAEHNRLITFISYYVSSTGLVFESSKSVTTLENCSQSAIWNHYLNSRDTYRSYSNELQTDILYDESGIYLIQGFQRNLDNSVAYLMVTLNPLIFTTNMEADKISIYNHLGNLVYGTEADFTLNSDASYYMDTFYLQEKEDSKVELYYQDSLTGWIFLYQPAIPTGSSLFTSSQNLLLFALVLLFAGLILCIFVSSYMYRPIHDLVQNAEEQFGGSFSMSDSKNEFDYLKSTYSKIMNHQEEMVALFPVIYHSVAEKIFYDLFFDYKTPSEELASRLDMLSEKFKYYQRFLVLLAVPAPLSENFNNQIQQLSQSISSLQDTVGKLSIFPKNDLGVIVVLGFHGNNSVAKIREDTSSWCQSIQKIQGNYANIQIGIGGICSNIMDVRSSLEDAKINLTFQQYASSLPSLPADDPLVSHADRNTIIREIRKIYDQLEFLEENELNKQMQEVLDNLQSSTMELMSKKVICGFFMNLLYTKFAALHLSPLETFEELTAQLFRMENESEIMDLMLSHAGDMIHAIWQYYHTPNYKYIQQALDYIANHFSDPNLSLETVSGYIGINPTYLSRIFKSILNQNFLHYVNNYRINHAKNLLQNSELSIQEISTLVGYTNMTTFFRVFKKYTDTTPRVFRQTCKPT